MPQRLKTLLNGLLQPAWEDRLSASQAQAVLTGQLQGSQQQQQQQQQRRDRQGWNVFGQDGWENARQSSRQSDSNGRVRIELRFCHDARDMSSTVNSFLRCVLCISAYHFLKCLLVHLNCRPAVQVHSSAPLQSRTRIVFC